MDASRLRDGDMFGYRYIVMPGRITCGQGKENKPVYELGSL